MKNVPASCPILNVTGALILYTLPPDIKTCSGASAFPYEKAESGIPGVARHEGRRKTVLSNEREPALIWQAGFAGSHDTLLIPGISVEARTAEGFLGRRTSWVRVTVDGGGAVNVEIPVLSTRP